MKTSTRDIVFIFAGLFVSIGTLWASRAGAEMRLGSDVAYLNTLGISQSGGKSLSQSIESRFRTEPNQIAELRKQRLGYGDISVVLATASRLRGGISKHNIERIVALWKNPRSRDWGKIIRSLGVRVERVVLQIEGLRGAQQAHGTQANASTPSAGTSPKGYDPVLRLVHGG
jgi:hypothetical protein